MLRGHLKTRTSRAADPASAPAIAKQGPRFQKRSQASRRHMAPSGCARLLAASIAFSSRTRADLRRAPPQDAQALRFHSALLISIFAAPSCFWRKSVILGGRCVREQAPPLRPFDGCTRRRRWAAWEWMLGTRHDAAHERRAQGCFDQASQTMLRNGAAKWHRVHRACGLLWRASVD